jgi:hypothetical protein
MEPADLKVFSQRMCLILANEASKITDVIFSKLPRPVNPRRVYTASGLI